MDKLLPKSPIRFAVTYLLFGLLADLAFKLLFRPQRVGDWHGWVEDLLFFAFAGAVAGALVAYRQANKQ